MRQNGTAANPCSAVKAASRVEGDDSQPVQHELDRQALEDLVTDAEALGRLEHRLNRLNIFEAAGMVRQELRHSDFLAFLLDPLRQHGLGDLFATRLLQKVLIQNRDRGLPVSPIDLDVWSLDGAFVLREWSNIDLLLVDKAHRLAVIIENKVDSLERPGQLAKYLRTVGAHYPDCDVVPIFLTPDGTLPAILDEQADPGLAHASESYIAVGYRLVVDVVEEILWERSSSIGADLNLLLAHYAELLRIHLVGESDIDSLCQTIYQKHRRALDLIYERRPDRQALIHPLLEGLVQQASGLEVDHSTKTIIRFVPTEWRVPALLKGDGTWTPSGMMLLFWFENSTSGINLWLEIGPGPEETRQQLFELALTSRPLRPSSKTLYRRFNRIYKRVMLGGSDVAEAELSDVEAQLQEFWRGWQEGDLQLILNLLRSQAWLGIGGPSNGQ